MSTLLDQILFLQKVSIFKNLSLDELAQIAQITNTQNFTEEEILFREGDPGDRAYIILSGSVELFRSESNQLLRLATLGEGTCFGEMALLDGQSRSATAQVVEKSLISTFSREDFMDVMDRFPKIGLGIIKVLSGRLRESNEKVNGLLSVVGGLEELYEKTKHLTS